MSTLMDRRKQETFYLRSDGTRETGLHRAAALGLKVLLWLLALGAAVGAVCWYLRLLP